MSRCHLLVEGQTEEAFANQLLRPHLETAGYGAVTISVITTKRPASGRNFHGGVSSWSKVRQELRLLLRDRGRTVTTLIDFYGMPSDAPGLEGSAQLADPRDRVERIEAAMATELGAANLVPHIMLHEFETLIYANPGVAARYLGSDSLEALMERDLQQCGGEPEDVDDGPNTAPSKRLQRHVPHYLKATSGPAITARIGLRELRERCPHFDAWLRRLEQRAGQTASRW